MSEAKMMKRTIGRKATHRMALRRTPLGRGIARLRPLRLVDWASRWPPRWRGPGPAAMDIGISTFAERTADPATGLTISPGERLRDVVQEIVLADQAGLDVYAIGEHHRPDFAASAPAVVLAAAATQTERIRLSSAV